MGNSRDVVRNRGVIFEEFDPGMYNLKNCHYLYDVSGILIDFLPGVSKRFWTVGFYSTECMKERLEKFSWVEVVVRENFNPVLKLFSFELALVC
jgi:hypothetical protein